MSNSIIFTTMDKMIKYYKNDPKRVHHALKVYSFAKNIGELENIEKEKLQILELAAILHDIGIPVSQIKYNSTAGKYQEIEGPPIARELLNEFKLKDDIMNRICFLIGSHHSYSKIDGIDFQILVEADFLVNIFEGNVRDETAGSVREKYFKTKTGISYFESMYGN